MRTRNVRVIIVGLALVVLAAAFFFGMLTVAPKSTNPAQMMKTVGQVSGAAGAIGIVMALVGLIGRKTT